jgi:hypothetical protein
MICKCRNLLNPGTPDLRNLGDPLTPGVLKNECYGVEIDIQRKEEMNVRRKERSQALQTAPTPEYPRMVDLVVSEMWQKRCWRNHRNDRIWLGWLALHLGLIEAFHRTMPPCPNANAVLLHFEIGLNGTGDGNRRDRK